jgi:hypothetical protein
VFQLPPEVKVGAYRVYPTVIDLAPPEGRGRDQAKSRIIVVTEVEIQERIRAMEETEEPSDGR